MADKLTAVLDIDDMLPAVAQVIVTIAFDVTFDDVKCCIKKDLNNVEAFE